MRARYTKRCTCGKKNRPTAIHDGPRGWQVICVCGKQGPSALTELGAIDAWNADIIKMRRPAKRQSAVAELAALRTRYAALEQAAREMMIPVNAILRIGCVVSPLDVLGIQRSFDALKDALEGVEHD